MSHLAGTYHRRLIGLRFQDQGAFVGAVIRAKGPLKLIINKWDGPNNQFEVARLPSEAELEVRNDFVLPLKIIMSEQAHALAGRPVLEALYKFISITEGIVSGIEAEPVLRSVLRGLLSLPTQAVP
jgi:hypothetical protein